MNNKLFLELSCVMLVYVTPLSDTDLYFLRFTKNKQILVAGKLTDMPRTNGGF